MSKPEPSQKPPLGDWIHLKKMEVSCVLGAYPAERRKPRKVRLDLSLACDLRRAMASDRLEDTLNYEAIEATAISIAQKGSFFLVETLAERVAEACLKYPPVNAVRVVVEKRRALPHTQSVAVEIYRRQD